VLVNSYSRVVRCIAFDPQSHNPLITKHIFGWILHQATLLVVSCRCVEGTKK